MKMNLSCPEVSLALSAFFFFAKNKVNYGLSLGGLLEHLK